MLGTPEQAPWNLQPSTVGNFYSGVSKIIIKPGVIANPDSTGLFKIGYILKSIDGLENLDTTQVTNMKSMFAGDRNLQTFDLSNFDTSNVTDMSYMFRYSDDLPGRMDFSKFDTSRVTDMSDMFSICNSITSLDVSNFNTEHVKTMHDMFGDMPDIKQIKGLDKFNTSQVTDMSQMFSGDQDLTELDVHKFDTSLVTNMTAMFSGLSSLKSNLFFGLSSFDTGNVTDMWAMFQNNTSLTDLSLSTFKTNKVTSMRWMFQNCPALTSLDISSFTTKNVTNMEQMFEGDVGLSSLDLSGFTANDSVDMWRMLSDCRNIWKIKLNKDFSSTDQYTGLPDVPGKGEIPGTKYVNTAPYWVALAGGTESNPRGKRNFYTSEKLMADQRTETDTYVWQQRSSSDQSSIKAKEEVDLSVGDKWNPQSGFISATDYWGDPVIFKNIKVSGDHVDTTKPGQYNVIYTNGNKFANTKVVVKAKAVPPTPEPQPTPQPVPSPTPTPQPKPDNNNTQASIPDWAAVKGSAVYSLKKIYLYKHNNFSKKDRLAGYTKKPRVYRPMFVVTGYARSKSGHLRYQVRDVNHLTKNRHKKGYITANWSYVRPVYYQSKHQTLTVINPRGVNAYKKANLTKKVRNYKQGTILHVTKFVHHNLTTRYVLSNGHFITGNRKLVKMGKQKMSRYVKVKRSLNRYQTVSLIKRNKHIKKGTELRIKNYDFSHANSVTKTGALRYHVVGGYITGNSKYVKTIK
ncbi:BspA family leucine-rich repeat surface protein [Lentilactobacillus sp. G22-6]|uniref:BspA family leucine-rich repeat surface protein n=2 Tax=Lentilactobacillus dabitei TaxID=2831523 RepID=UPI001C2514BE|nr:BspA family leucine-rich repeat surface protein [Lentilactobacillus dabitei]MBU9789432.1 BspA family leucine-rich repeat surface protein [Lentilactobacillus dabitei]